jgi:hypothetical protein
MSQPSLFAALGAVVASRKESIGSVTATTEQLQDVFRILVEQKVRQPFFVTFANNSFLIIFKERVYSPRCFELKTLLEEKGVKVKVNRPLSR